MYIHFNSSVGYLTWWPWVVPMQIECDIHLGSRAQQVRPISQSLDFERGDLKSAFKTSSDHLLI